MRPDQPRPTFAEDGYAIFNRYRPPAHPATGGDLAAFESFFAHLIPDEAERTWLWHWLAHKARRPWMPMVAVIMVAEEFGSGRGTLFDILELVFGKDYVVPCSFGELTGKAPGRASTPGSPTPCSSSSTRRSTRTGTSKASAGSTYDALKNAFEPSPTARRRFEAEEPARRRAAGSDERDHRDAAYAT